MRRTPWADCDAETPGNPDRLPPSARSFARLPRPNWAPVSVLAIIAGILVTVATESEIRDLAPPDWSSGTGHPLGISALALSPDGRWLATGGSDTAVVVWEVGKGPFRVLSRDRPSRVQCLAFSPDGATVAASYDGAELVLWNVAAGERRATLHGRYNQFVCLAFSPDGKTLASGGAESDIHIWDVETGTARAAFTGRRGLTSALRFAPDGKSLAAGYSDGIATIWDLASGRAHDLLGTKLPNEQTLALAFSPDGSLLASGSSSYGSRLWDVATGEERLKFRDEEENVRVVAFRRDAPALVAVRQSRLAVLRDVDSGSTRVLCRATGEHYSALTPDAHFLATADEHATVRVWDLAHVELRSPDTGRPLPQAEGILASSLHLVGDRAR